MSDSVEQRRARLAAAAQALGLAPSEGQLAALLGYLDLLQRWNAVYNLTAVRDPEQMLTQHLVDCLAVLPALQRHADSRQDGRALRILDVGSGGGLPGVVLAVLEPRWKVTCVDTVGKKAAFIRQAGAELGLRNLQAEHARVEALRAERFDLITSRAFASLGDFVRLTRQLLAPGGVWVAMKGRQPQEEVAALPADIDVFHVEPFSVPGLNAERCLIWMRESVPGAPGLVHS